MAVIKGIIDLQKCVSVAAKDEKMQFVAAFAFNRKEHLDQFKCQKHDNLSYISIWFEILAQKKKLHEML